MFNTYSFITDSFRLIWLNVFTTSLTKAEKMRNDLYVITIFWAKLYV